MDIQTNIAGLSQHTNVPYMLHMRLNIYAFVVCCFNLSFELYLEDSASVVPLILCILEPEVLCLDDIKLVS